MLEWHGLSLNRVKLMSQVVGVKDEFEKQRRATQQQEERIRVEQVHRRWCRPVAARVLTLEKGLLVALMLVVLPLLLLALVLAAVFFLFVCCCQLIGNILRGKHGDH